MNARDPWVARFATQGVLAALLMAVVVGLLSRDVHASCPDVNNWGVNHAPIKVRLHDENSDGLFLGLSAAEVGRAVARVIDNINENGMANIRLQWDGVVNIAPSSVDGILAIVEAANPCNGADGCFAKWPALGGQYTDGTISIRSTQLWAFYPEFGYGTDSRDLPGTLTHELVHSLGLLHSGSGGDCPGDTGWGVVEYSLSNEGTEKRNLSRDDVEGLWSIYGRRVGTIKHHESPDGIAWASGTPALSEATYGPLSSASSPVLHDGVGWFSFLGQGLVYDRVLRKTKTIGGFSASAFVTPFDSTSRSFDAPATAFGKGVTLVTWFHGELTSNARKAIRYGISNDNGATWVVADAVDSGGAIVTTRRDGLTATYDPNTERFVISYLGDNFPSLLPCQDPPGEVGFECDDIRFFTVRSDGSGGKHSSLVFNSEHVKAVDAPGLACRDQWGSVPCLMTWVSITGSACVHWGRFDVLASGEVSLYEDYATGCIWGFQTPQIANIDTDISKPFRLTLRQEGNLGNGNRVYALRRGFISSLAWVDQTSFSVAPWVLSPTYGAFDFQQSQTWLTEHDVYYVVPYN